MIVDGNNVAYCGSSSNKPKVWPLMGIRKLIVKEGFEPVILVSSALRYSIDDRETLLRLIQAGLVEETESGMDDDIAILERASEASAQWIVSNDSFAEYLDIFPWINGRVRRFHIKATEIELE